MNRADGRGLQDRDAEAGKNPILELRCVYIKKLLLKNAAVPQNMLLKYYHHLIHSGEDDTQKVLRCGQESSKLTRKYNSKKGEIKWQ